MNARQARIAFFGILAVSMLVRAALLYSGNRGVSADEAVVGLMGKHIVEKGERPVYLYGQASHGGAALEAYAAAVSYKIFGFRPLALRAVPLAIFAAGSWILFEALLALSGPPAAIAGAVLWCIGAPLLRFSWTAQGGYLESCAALFGVIWLAASRLRPDRAIISMGVLIGLESWLLGISTPAMLVLAGFYVWHRRPKIVYMAAGIFAAIALPTVIWLAAGMPSRSSSYLLRAIPSFSDLVRLSDFHRLFWRDLPGFMGPFNIDVFPEKIGFAHWAGFLALLSLAVAGFISGKKSWVVRALSAALAVHLVIYLISPLSGLSPRHLLPAYAVAVVLAAIGAASFMEHGRPQFHEAPSVPPGPQGPQTSGMGQVQAGGPVGRPPRPHSIFRISAAAAILLWCALFLFNAKKLWRTDITIDGVMSEKGWVVCDRRELLDVIDRLRSLGISNVYATYFPQWRIIFESREQIIASSLGLFPHVYRYAAYDGIVEHADKFAYVVHQDDKLNVALTRRLSVSKIRYSVDTVGSFLIYYKLGHGTRPGELFKPIEKGLVMTDAAVETEVK